MATIVVLAGIVAVGWYLGSPLFIRTTADEALPSARPAAASAAAPARLPAGVGTPVSAPPPGPRTTATGELGHVDALHNGRGTVLLLRTGEDVFLRFDQVAITNAPDVHVYLSPDIGGKWSEGTSLYLGPLKATNGSFNYAVPVGTDVATYRSVVVWCRQFSVLITWADLRTP
ncbi:MAG TPA: DM13 domain-containing protein [Candidatus Limnocylindria bacterium]